MARLWCSLVEADPDDYRGPTPGPTGLLDVAEPRLGDAPDTPPESTPGVAGVSDTASVAASGPLALPGVQPVRSDMTPQEYMRCYRELDVPYVLRDTGQICHVTADVHVYVNAGLTNRRSNEREKGAVQGHIRQCARDAQRGREVAIATDRGRHLLGVAHAYFGKGDPWEYRVYLAYALTFGRTTPQTLATYCDAGAKLGLDCSGFVNSFLVSTGRVGRARDINDYTRNTPRTSFAQVQPNDLLIWQGADAGASRHIAIVDSVLQRNQMLVVESSGSKGGLAASVYTVESVERLIFRVNRGADEQGRPYRQASMVKIVAHDD